MDIVASGGFGLHRFTLFDSYTKAWFDRYQPNLMEPSTSSFIQEFLPEHYYPHKQRTQYSTSFENLPVGDYTVVSVDENGCGDVQEFSILALPKFEFNVSRVAKTCDAQTMGDVRIANVTSDYGPFTYSLLTEGANF